MSDKTKEEQKESNQIYLEKRISTLKKARKSILNDGDEGFNFDELMRNADREYVPHQLNRRPKTSSVYLESDETLGIRGARVVPIAGNDDESWRSDVSEPTLFVKVNTALSILMQQNPDAEFKGSTDRYKKTSKLAKAIWKRSWDIACSREQMQLFIHNLAKYGWAPGRTYPRIEKRKKKVLTELDVHNPEKNKYEEKTIVDFNDVYREALDPHRTWIDDAANMYDQWSLNDWFFEKDYTYDDFKAEFGQYSNFDKVEASAPYRDSEGEANDLNDETKQRDDMVTVCFYENRRKDMYLIYIPKDKVLLYGGPLPNDDGMLTYWDSVWNLRDPRTRFGIGLYEILKNDKVMYDRWDNMTTDQLVMAVYKMLFFSGPAAPGDGKIRVEPGVAVQKLPGTSIETVDIKFEPRAFEWLDRRRERINENTGVTPTLQGAVEGKTLGEVLHAKDAALKRLSIPLANIASAIEKDVYLTLSWANQVYSLPETFSFSNEKQLEEYMSENSREYETASVSSTGEVSADFPRILDLSLDTDKNGELVESPESRALAVGTSFGKKAIKWKGRVTVKVQSMIAPSQELDRQRKLELYNLVMPIIQAIAQAIVMKQYSVAMNMSRPVMQILEIQEEKPEDWLPKEVIRMLENPELASKAEEFAQQEDQSVQAAAGQIFVDPNAPLAAPSDKQTGVTPVAGRDSVSNPVRNSVEQLGGQKMM